MSKALTYDAVVIGGGFFGCTISLYLKKYMNHVLVLEKEADLLQRASYVNQARVHNGYHYPRSVLTALRSHINFPKFVNEYQECIVSNFDNYYAISKLFTKVNANQFKRLCDYIGSPVEIAPSHIKKLFNNNLIAEVFRTKEYVFDAVKLKQRMYSELEREKIELRLEAEVIKLQNTIGQKGLEITISKSDNVITAKYVFNCAYSALNTILLASHLPTIPLKHELAEIALVKLPEPIRHLGVTVMCGPFFSIMPFPSRDLYTLSHVRYTPHCYWQDTENFATSKIYDEATRKTNYPYMIRDAERYMPILKDCSYVDSIWEIKTVLPQSEVDDSRPILFKRNQVLPNLTCVLGGKIDNVYDIPNELQFIEHEGFVI